MATNPLLFSSALRFLLSDRKRFCSIDQLSVHILPVSALLLQAQIVQAFPGPPGSPVPQRAQAASSWGALLAPWESPRPKRGRAFRSVAFSSDFDANLAHSGFALQTRMLYHFVLCIVQYTSLRKGDVTVKRELLRPFFWLFQGLGVYTLLPCNRWKSSCILPLHFPCRRAILHLRQLNWRELVCRAERRAYPRPYIT